MILNRQTGWAASSPAAKQTKRAVTEAKRAIRANRFGSREERQEWMRQKQAKKRLEER